VTAVESDTAREGSHRPHRGPTAPETKRTSMPLI